MKISLWCALMALVVSVFPATAWADAYVNPHDSNLRLASVDSGCHRWGSSARCGESGSARFYFKDKWPGCWVIIDRENMTFKHRWHYRIGSWPVGHHDDIECTAKWQNDNTLDVFAKLRK